MGTTVKVHRGQITIPIRLRERAGISDGDLVEAKLRNGCIVLERMDRGAAAIREGLAAAEADRRAGRVYGPFTHPELRKFLQAETKRRARRPAPLTKKRS